MKNFTLLCTIAKPLKYISEDTNDLIHLTLAMFMGNVKEFGTPDLEYIELNPNIMKWRLRFLHKLREDLRDRFHGE